VGRLLPYRLGDALQERIDLIYRKERGEGTTNKRAEFDDGGQNGMSQEAKVGLKSFEYKKKSSIWRRGRE